MISEKRKPLIIGILAATVAITAGIGIYYWYNNAFFVSTEDARVATDLVRVSPQVSGKIVELEIEEGDSLVKDQIIGRQEAVNSAQAGIESTIIRAPISGVVVKKQGMPGELVSFGQTIAVLADLDKVYISANIEEDKLSKIKLGQDVDVSIDEYKDAGLKGKVKSIGFATNSAFSLLPSSAGGTFTKTVQRVPVKIEIDKKGYELLPGTNAVVKIHVK